MYVQRQTVALGRISRFSGLTLLPSPPIIQGVPFDVSASVFRSVSAPKSGAEPLIRGSQRQVLVNGVEVRRYGFSGGAGLVMR